MMWGVSEKITFADNPAEDRYEVLVDGEVAGFARYRARPERLEFVHTEVEDRFEGHGLGARLAAFALDDARDRSLEVVPICPFINSFIQHHPEYTELVPEKLRPRFGLPAS
jgi:predicted GNAT family acetyltransferase